MHIYTGYFAKLQTYTAAGLVPVGIALRPPAWYHGASLKNLAPTAKMLYMKDWEYIPAYREGVLGFLHPEQVKDALEQFAKHDEDVVLLCFEKPAEFCHRQLVAKWLRDAGIPCEEYDEHLHQKPKEPETLTLF
ncbi:MAG: DUF488 domain-containing protein [Chlorobiaceae bacterium]|nr:DUF488 domain-containing protein [Chlorobiaceae bacterium]